MYIDLPDEIKKEIFCHLNFKNHCKMRMVSKQIPNYLESYIDSIDTVTVVQTFSNYGSYDPYKDVGGYLLLGETSIENFKSHVGENDNLFFVREENIQNLKKLILSGYFIGIGFDGLVDTYEDNNFFFKLRILTGNLFKKSGIEINNNIIKKYKNRTLIHLNKQNQIQVNVYNDYTLEYEKLLIGENFPQDVARGAMGACGSVGAVGAVGVKGIPNENDPYYIWHEYYKYGKSHKLFNLPNNPYVNLQRDHYKYKTLDKTNYYLEYRYTRN